MKLEQVIAQAMLADSVDVMGLAPQQGIIHNTIIAIHCHRDVFMDTSQFLRSILKSKPRACPSNSAFYYIYC